MSEFCFDMTVELDPATLILANNPEHEMAEASLHAAKAHCDKHNIRLISQDPIAIVVDRAFNPETRRNVVLVGTRWRAQGEVPQELKIARWKAGNPG